MNDVYTGTLKWLEQQVPEQKSKKSLLDLATETDDLEQQEKLPVPEPYMLLLRLRRFNTMYWSGGYGDQPNFLMQELEAASNAEAEYKHVQNVNAVQRAINAKAQQPNL